MMVYGPKEFGEWVADAVQETICDERFAAATSGAITDCFGQMAEGLDYVFVVLDGGWPHGCSKEHIDRWESHEIMLEAARSYEVQRAIRDQIVMRLAARGYTPDEE